MNHLDQLPAEIISSILHHVGAQDLKACALINHGWYTVTSPLLWRSPKIQSPKAARQFLHFLFKPSPTTTTTTTTLSLSSSAVGQWIRHLDLWGTLWTDAIFLRLMQHVPNLVSLDIVRAEQITDASFLHLGRHCRQLTSLCLNKVPITQLSIDALGQHCHQLSKLSLTSCSRLSYHAVSALVQCPLKELTLCVLKPMPPPHSSTITDLDLYRFHDLTHLTLIKAPYRLIQRLLLCSTPSSMLPRLSTLKIGRATRLTESDMPRLVEFLEIHRHISNLTLQGSHLTDTILHAMPPHLTRLDLSFNHTITERGVRRLVEKSPRLTWIELTDCYIRADAFPEAGSSCAGSLFYSDRHQECIRCLKYLDQQAINWIQLATQNQID